MIFVARQLVEKAREHGESLYVLFVDLRKAYDSVPRQALWKVLEKYGVPEKMLNVVKSFHEGMHAELRVGSTVTERFEVRMAYGRDVPWHPHYLISTLVLWWLIGAIGVVVQE